MDLGPIRRAWRPACGSRAGRFPRPRNIRPVVGRRGCIDGPTPTAPTGRGPGAGRIPFSGCPASGPSPPTTPRRPRARPLVEVGRADSGGPGTSGPAAAAVASRPARVVGPRPNRSGGKSYEYSPPTTPRRPRAHPPESEGRVADTSALPARLWKSAGPIPAAPEHPARRRPPRLHRRAYANGADGQGARCGPCCRQVRHGVGYHGRGLDAGGRPCDSSGVFRYSLARAWRKCTT